MGGCPAAGGEDALRGGHAVEVVGRGLDAHQHHLVTAGSLLGGAIGVEDGHAHGGTRGGVEAPRDARGRGQRRRIELVAQQLVDLVRLDARECLALREDARLDHVHGDAYGSRGGALGGTRLEHVEAAALDGELEVLHVAVVGLQPLGDAPELGVGLGQLIAHSADGVGRADARHHVLALGVGEVLPVEHFLARVGVAREGHAGARVVAHVAEDHCHHVDRGAQVVGDLVVVAIVAGPLAEP